MQPIDPGAVQRMLHAFQDTDVYLFLEMTTGAYASLMDNTKFTASAFVKNAVIRYSQGSIAGDGPYRVGLKLPHGWVYAQGLTHWDETASDKLLLAGHDHEGKLVVGLYIGREPL